MNFRIKYITITILLFAFYPSFGQCDVNETEVVFELSTDAWGYEVYWELLNQDGTCGLDVLESGGNADQVGCEGAFDQDATGGNGYDSNITFELEPFCLENGTTYLIEYIDDYGDGGLTFNIFQNGVLTDIFIGSGGGNSWEFTIGESSLPQYDLPCIAYETEIDAAPFTINTEDATASAGEPVPAPGNCGVYGFWCENGLSRTVWVKFIGPESGAIQISTCNPNTNFDTQIALYRSDDCDDWANFTFITSNDDTQIGGCDGGNGFASDMFADCLIPGAEYYVQLDGWAGAFGTFEMEIFSVEEPVILLSTELTNITCAPPKGESGFNGIAATIYGLDTDFNYTWSGPDEYESTASVITELEEGTYDLVVTTDCGYEFEESFEILGAPQPINVSVDIDHPNCEESMDGSIEAFPNGGVDPFEFQWTYIEGSTIVSDESIANDLLPGTYILTLEDNNGCVYDNTYSLNPEGINFSLGSDTTICTSDAFIINAPEGYDYLWQDGSTEDLFLFNGSDYEPGPHAIVVTVSNDEGCNESQAVIVNVEICTSVEETFLTGIAIVPNPIIAKDLKFEGNYLGSRYSIYNSVGQILQEGTIQSNEINLDLSSGVYYLQLTNNGKIHTESFVIR